MIAFWTKRFLGALRKARKDPRAASRRRVARAFVGLSVSLVLGLGWASPSCAAGKGGDSEASPLTIHAFLTQGFGKSDGFTIFGIPEEGTTDLRTLALQFRYDLSPQDVFVLQLNHERTGLDPVSEKRPDVALDWAFYERRLGSGRSIKVGRIPVPFGVYNEIRDVGTVLP